MSQNGEEHTDVVEIDAIGAEEWERDRHTPQAIESNLAALVKQSATSNSGPVRSKALDEGWDEPAVEVIKPRTTTNTLRRDATPVLTGRRTQALGTPIMQPATAPVVVAKRGEVKPAPSEAKPPVAKSNLVGIGARPGTAPGAAKPPARVTTGPAQPAPPTGGWVAKTRAASPSVDPTFAPFAPPFTATPIQVVADQPANPRPPTPLPRVADQPVKSPKPTPQPMVTVQPAKSLKPTPQPMAAISPKPKLPTPTPQPMAEITVETVKARAPTPPPKRASEFSGDATKPLAADFAAPSNPFGLAMPDDWADPTSTGVRMPPATDLSAEPVKPRAATPAPVLSPIAHRAPSELAALPVSTAPRGSEPDMLAPMLPPPPAMATADFEDWDNPNANTSLGNRVPPKPRAVSVMSEFKDEDSVVVDFNAVPQDGAAKRRPISQPVIQTSEQSTTTSGAFLMPTASSPKGIPAPAARPVVTPAPTMPESALAAAASPFQRPSAAWHTPLPQPLPGQPTAAAIPFPSAVGLVDDLAVPTPIKVDPTSPARAHSSLFATPERRRAALLFAGGAVVLVIVLMFALSGGSPAKPEQIAGVTKPTTPTSTPAMASTPTSTPAHASPSATKPVAVATTRDTTTTKSEPPITKKPVVAKRRFTRAKKPVIVDYDKAKDPTPSQDEALANARTAYAMGNQHLFAGQAAAAVASYKQALADYPGYIAGYRGLGLAYAQQGDRAAALAAFKTYVKLAPTAKDVALIQKRISNLSIAH